MVKWFSDRPGLRRWIYGVATAGLPLLIAYGVVAEAQAPLWASLISAVLVPGLAWVNTPGPGAGSGEEDSLPPVE